MIENDRGENAVNFIYTRGSFNKYNEFSSSVGNKKYCLAAPFSRKLIEMGPFMSQKIVSMTFFTSHGAWNFIFTGESVCFPTIDCLVVSGK